MKLDDIDILIRARSNYSDKSNMLKSVKHGEVFIRFGSITITSSEMQKEVRLALLPSIQKEFDEAKTKLMMLGITEFPE